LAADKNGLAIASLVLLGAKHEQQQMPHPALALPGIPPTSLPLALPEQALRRKRIKPI
jgi:hypothetical protein